MSETNFVYYLMSNASMGLFKDNKPQHFRTQLPSPLNLDGEWEVGLSAIIYPHNWNNIKSESKFSLEYGVNSPGRSAVVKIDITITNKQFKDLDDCVRVLNEVINEQIHDNLFAAGSNATPYHMASKGTYNYLELAITKNSPKRLFLKKYGSTATKIILPAATSKERELWRLLGFDETATSLVEGGIAKNPASITLHFPSLYIYSPIIEYVGVGDTRAPLFAIVPIKGEMGDMIYERFDRPIYCHLTQKYIPEIEINIKDDTGDDVEFGAGKTILILHFRKRS